jgi:hypothetical protein
MTSANLVRWGGIAAVVAGILWLILVFLFNPQGVMGDLRLPGALGTVLLVVTLLAQLVGIASLHVLQRDRYGKLGAVGSLLALGGIAALILLFVGASLLADGGVLSAILIAILALVGVFMPIIGLALLGVATLQVRVLPRWVGLLLSVGLPIAVLLGIVLGAQAGAVAFGIFWILVGYAIMFSGGIQTQRPPRVR